VQFWKRGEPHAYNGYTTNISPTGMFVGTSNPVPRGSQIRVEILDPQRGFVVECKVARAVKVPPGLQQVQLSGMGIRFMAVEELVADLFGGTMIFRPEEERPPKDGVYSVRFRSVNHFLETMRRDVQTGGIFVPTRFPAALNSAVTVEIHPPDGRGDAVRLAALVVQRFEPKPSASGELAGMGVAFADAQGALALLQPLIARFQS
jgi:Tfp pilus assembly protein PilZ